MQFVHCMFFRLKKKVQVFWNYSQVRKRNMMRKIRLGLVQMFYILTYQSLMNYIVVKWMKSKETNSIKLYSLTVKALLRYMKMVLAIHPHHLSHKIFTEMARRQDPCHWLRFLQHVHLRHSFSLLPLKTKRRNLKHFMTPALWRVLRYDLRQIFCLVHCQTMQRRQPKDR